MNEWMKEQSSRASVYKEDDKDEEDDDGSG